MGTDFDQLTDSPFQQVNVVGTPVSLVSFERLLSVFDKWVASGQDRYIVFRDVHGVIAARNNPQLDQAHKRADVVAPDGMPLRMGTSGSRSHGNSSFMRSGLFTSGL